MEVSLHPLSPALAKLMCSTSKASCILARSYPTVDLEMIVTTSEELSWLGTYQTHHLINAKGQGSKSTSS
jgi:hypothetical protein